MKFPLPTLNRHFSSIDGLQGIFSVFGGLGVGKTIFAIQTALASLQTSQDVFYFYSKPQLPIYAIKTLYQGMLKELPQNPMEAMKFITVKDFNELLEISFNLEFLYLNELERSKSKKKLIIIDSITDLYKLKLDPNKKQYNVNLNHRLNHILANFHYLAKKYEIDIFLVNELSRGSEGESTLSGGRVMSYWVSYALELKRTQVLNKRKALLSQPGSKAVLSFEMNLTKDGFKSDT